MGRVGRSAGLQARTNHEIRNQLPTTNYHRHPNKKLRDLRASVFPKQNTPVSPVFASKRFETEEVGRTKRGGSLGGSAILGGAQDRVVRSRSVGRSVGLQARTTPNTQSPNHRPQTTTNATHPTNSVTSVPLCFQNKQALQKMDPEEPNSISEEYLPAFAQQWMRQWESAGPKLQAIRERELRELDNRKLAASHRKLTHAEARGHGLAIQQAWFMRMRLLELEKSKERNAGP